MLCTFLTKLRNWSIKEEYNIGFVDNTYEDIISGKPLSVKWMAHSYKDSWFADPFILDVTDTQIYLLVEDFYYPIGRGRISLLKVNRRTYVCEERIPLLTLNTHLSFPAIFRIGNEVFVYPESGLSGKLKLYRYENEKMIEVETLAEGTFSDAIITNLWGSDYYFTTCSSTPEEETSIQYIYRIDRQNLIFQLFPKIRFKDKTARNAGDFFKIGNRIYRPAQDCRKNYGGGIIIHEVFQYSNGEFGFKEVCRLNAKYKNLQLGAHTFNSYKGIFVIDAHGYCNPLLARIAKLFM